MVSFVDVFPIVCDMSGVNPVPGRFCSGTADGELIP